MHRQSGPASARAARVPWGQDRPGTWPCPTHAPAAYWCLGAAGPPAAADSAEYSRRASALGEIRIAIEQRTVQVDRACHIEMSRAGPRRAYQRALAASSGDTTRRRRNQASVSPRNRAADVDPARGWWLILLDGEGGLRVQYVGANGLDTGNGSSVAGAAGAAAHAEDASIHAQTRAANHSSALRKSLACVN